MQPEPPSTAAFPSIPLEEWRRAGQFFEYQGHRIFYRTAGEKGAEPLLLIHGYPTASWDFSRLWGPLSARFLVIAPDMLGFGFSGKPRSFAYSVFAQASLLQALLGKLGIERCQVLAHDYGDTIAQELLARHLEGKPCAKLRSVCFLNGGLFPETHRALLVQKLALSPIGPLIARFLSRRQFDATMTGLFSPDGPPSAEELDGFWHLVTSDGGRLVMPKHIRYIVERRVHRERWVGALIKAAKAGIPLRLIDGAVDKVSGAHMAARYRELIPHPDVVLLERVGHYPQVEAPGGVLAAFLKFQERL